MKEPFTTAANGLPVIFGVDASAFMLDVENQTSLPCFGVFETTTGTTDAYGNFAPYYELYCFYDCTFKDERKEPSETEHEAINLLRNFILNLKAYAVGSPSTFTRFDGEAFGGVFCTLAIATPTNCM